MKTRIDRISVVFFAVSIVSIFFCYGLIVARYHVFPYRVLKVATEEYRELFLKSKNPDWWIKPTEYPHRPAIYNSGQACPGLNLVTSIGAGNMLSVKIMDLDGRTIHEWIIDWFKMWPDAKHLPERMVPRSRPGTHVEGALVMNNGDLVFNFHRLGLVRIDMQGKVRWRLPYQTHHSVYKDEAGNLLVCGKKEHVERSAWFSNRKLPFVEDTILEVSAQGKIIREWSVAEILIKNGLRGLFYLRTFNNSSIEVNDGDGGLHLNDAEPFPARLKEGLFKKGDILVSLRNLQTIFVFNRENGKIKFIVTGMSIWQHDPDFIDGNTISVLDNNIYSGQGSPKSRIIIISAPEKTTKVFFEGNPQAPFYTEIWGRHQWLPNGNLLITEAIQGRAFELNQRSQIVWEYINYIDQGIISVIAEVQRLLPEYTRLFSDLESVHSKAH